MTNNIYAPYIHTEKTINDRVIDWAIALLPVFVWSIFMFGARVISLCLVGGIFAILLDFPVRAFILKMPKGSKIDFMAAIYGILTVFMMPVTVPLFMPVVSSALVVLAKNIRAIKGKRLFNPFVFSAAVLNLVFPKVMTAFTKPFAYFSAFSFVLDPKLVDNYRVISPLQYMADGSVYEDGVLAQLYGFASGNIGEIAVAAMVLSLIWLIYKKEADFYGTVAVIFTVLLLALAFPSNDAESNYYAYAVILSGSIVFLSVFGINESHTVPLTFFGRIITGVLLGALIFLFRKIIGGFDCGYLILLVLNVASPFIEMLTRSTDKKKPKQKTKKKPIKDEGLQTSNEK